MVNILTRHRQPIISSSSYLPDNPPVNFSSSDSHDEQINNTYFSMAIGERLTLLQSIFVTVLPTEITGFIQPQKQQKLVATELIIPINLPFTNTEITPNVLRLNGQHHSITIDGEQKSYPINQLAIEKQTSVSNPIGNHQIGVKIKPTMVAKHHSNHKLITIEEETIAKSSLTDGDTHLKGTSHKTVKTNYLSPTTANELNSIELAEQENYRSVTDSNNLANNDSLSALSGWPTLQTIASHQTDITAKLPAKKVTTAVPLSHSSPEAELRYTFTQWQGTHHVDIYRIAPHQLQLMASNSHVMSILQRHLNERASLPSLSLSDTLKITLNEVLDNSDEPGDESP